MKPTLQRDPIAWESLFSVLRASRMKISRSPSDHYWRLSSSHYCLNPYLMICASRTKRTRFLEREISLPPNEALVFRQVAHIRRRRHVTGSPRHTHLKFQYVQSNPSKFFLARSSLSVRVLLGTPHAVIYPTRARRPLKSSVIDPSKLLDKQRKCPSTPQR